MTEINVHLTTRAVLVQLAFDTCRRYYTRCSTLSPSRFHEGRETAAHASGDEHL
jgi:hypothetical protein